MPTPKLNPAATQQILDLFVRLPLKAKVALSVLAGLVFVAYAAGAFNTKSRSTVRPNSSPETPAILEPTLDELRVQNTNTDSTAKDIFFCFWNVENLFDDKDDKRRTVDEQYDNPFAQNEKLRDLKLERLASTLLKMNSGKGPDVIACVEVESVRALELLQGALNAKITDPKFKYNSIAMKNLDAGRHIAPGLISRLPLSQQRTRLLETKSQLRILETHLFVNNHDLCIIASHWTSKLRQNDGGNGDEGRKKYAHGIYDYYKSLASKDSDVDFLLCGDFNDTPDAEVMTHDLGALGDVKKVKAGGEFPAMLNLMYGKSADKFGTIMYQGKPLIYDHVCVSRGMLDEKGWSCDPESVQTYTNGLIRVGATRREPWRFGDPDREQRDSERGYSDHFPVTVKLKVRATQAKQ